MALVVIATSLIRDFWARGGFKGSETAAGSEQRGRHAESIPYAPAIAAGVWLSLVGAT
jgi:hypothetical protein